MDVAIGVYTARPPDLACLIVTRRLIGQQRREFLGSDRDVDPRLACHGLYDLHQLQRDRGVGHLHLKVDAIGKARFGQQFLGLFHVTLRHGIIGAVPRGVRREGLVARGEGTIKDDLIDRLAVDRIAQRLTQTFVVAPRVVALFAIGHVDRDALIAERHGAFDIDAVVTFGLREVGRGQTLQHVDVTRLQVRQTHGGVGDRQIGDGVEVVFLGIVIVGEFLKHDAVLGHALFELVGAGADRVQAKVIARGLSSGGGDHHACAVGELRHQRGIGIGQIKADLMAAQHFDAGDGGKLGLAARSLHVLAAVDVGGHGLGIKGRSIVEDRIVAQFHGQLFAVFGKRPFGCELRDDFEVGCDVHQLVAERRVDDAAHEGARLVGVQHIGIGLQRDAQVSRLRAEGRGPQQCSGKCHFGQCHVELSCRFNESGSACYSWFWRGRSVVRSRMASW